MDLRPRAVLGRLYRRADGTDNADDSGQQPPVDDEPCTEAVPASNDYSPEPELNRERGGGRLPDWRAEKKPLPGTDAPATEREPHGPPAAAESTDDEGAPSDDNDDQPDEEAPPGDEPADNEPVPDAAPGPGPTPGPVGTSKPAPGAPVPAVGTRNSAPPAQALYDVWKRLDDRQRFLARNGAAAGCGAFIPGLFGHGWHVGLPQLVVTWMQAAQADGTSTWTGLWFGGFVVLGAAVSGSTVIGILARFTQHVSTLYRVTHWCLVRVPVASAITAVCAYDPHS